jgi:hypothetical protein
MYDQAPHTHSYETVAAGQTDQVLGGAGGVGDYLERLIVTVATAATGTVEIQDGDGTAIPITAANTPIGVYPVELRIRARNATTPGWKVTTGAGATAIGIGQFTA